MLELLATFSVKQIIVYSIMLALAIKGTISFFDWCKEKYQEKFNKDYLTLNKQEKFEKQYLEFLEKYDILENKIDNLTEGMKQRVNEIDAQLKLLTKSDMHDIKGWVVDKHHELIKQQWVDDFTMDVIERRFSDYEAENGNSYISGLVSEIRALPHVPPNETE